MVRVRDYIDIRGRSRFREWFDDLDAAAATKVSVCLERLEQGHQSAIKSVGGGVRSTGSTLVPGYRLYFGRDGDELVILLCGGTKKRQDRDIADSKAAWNEYKRRKREKE